MCLNTVIDIFSPPQPRLRIAWKVYDRVGHTLRSPFGFGSAGRKGRWQKARQAYLGPYMSGFHVLPTRAEAVKFASGLAYCGKAAIVKVLVRGVHTTGKQSSCLVLVAEEMCVLPLPKAKR